jgi:hypothetical protein
MEWYQDKMFACRLITLAVLVLSSPAEAQLARTPWRAVVAPPRQSFPTVTIDLGYPGPYIPWQNAPITLRASAGDYPFDGYIGFDFRVNDRLTYDTPVIARAVLRPHQEWRFTTFARLRRFAGAGRSVPREIAIEWRNRTMGVAAVRSAGLPPWSTWTEPLRPLLVVASGEELAEKVALGRTASVQRANGLSDQAQWYAGFSDLVVPLGMWLDLPRSVREAIFGSGIHVVSFGFARPNQALDDIDRALLPVTLSAKPSSYVAPWPYRQSRTAPVSWMAKNGARFAGSGQSPYIVQNAAATWTADEIGVSQPLPAMTPIPVRLRIAAQRSSAYDPKFHVRKAWPRPAQLLRMFPAPALSIAAVIVSLSAWMAIRKKTRAAAMIALLLLAGLILAARDSIRPPAGAYYMDIRAPVSPGIIRSIHARRVYGPTPIPEETGNAERMRTSVTGVNEWGQNAEVRTSTTAVAMGLMMSRGRDWDAITRWSVRRELGEPPVIRIRSRDPKKMVIEFESPIPIGYVHATWIHGATMYFGGTAIPEQRSGRVTIAHGSDLQEESEPSVWPGPTLARWHASVVELRQKNRTSSRLLYWFEPVADEKSFVIGSSATQESARTVSWRFALPLESTSADATMLVSVFHNSPSNQVSISWANGITAIQPSGRTGLMFAPSYVVPPAVFRAILAGGGIVKLTVTGEQPTDPRAWIEVSEKKS